MSREQVLNLLSIRHPGLAGDLVIEFVQEHESDQDEDCWTATSKKEVDALFLAYVGGIA